MTRVVFVLQEPTPYRTPHLAAVAARPELDVTVAYSARTVHRRSWETPTVGVVYLRGPVLPLTRVLHHDYSLTPGIWRLLGRLRPDVVVLGGWSVMATQLALVWCRVHRVPYVLMADNTLLDPRPSWVLALKRLVLPRVVPQAAAWLVPGTRARDHVVHYGADPARVFTFPLTIDVATFAARVDDARIRRGATRVHHGIPADAVVVLHVGRLIEQKGADVLLRAAAGTGTHVVLAGDGPEETALRRLAAELGTPATFVGMVEPDALVELYAAADVFALASRRETWGVVVNEAAAAGLPLVLSERVGAATDLLVDGENGILVPAGDAAALREALQRLAADEEMRRTCGACSRELVAPWGYERSVEELAALVQELAA